MCVFEDCLKTWPKLRVFWRLFKNLTTLNPVHTLPIVHGLAFWMIWSIFRLFCCRMSGKVKAPVPDYPILSSSLDYCSVCDAPIKFEDRPEDKDPLTVYGLNGSYQVSMIILSLLGCQNCFFFTSDRWFTNWSDAISETAEQRSTMATRFSKAAQRSMTRGHCTKMCWVSKIVPYKTKFSIFSLFIGPRCTWGPIYGSQSLLETLLELNWSDSSWSSYQLNTSWYCQYGNPRQCGNGSDSTWWTTLELMQVAPPDDQI